MKPIPKEVGWMWAFNRIFFKFMMCLGIPFIFIRGAAPILMDAHDDSLFWAGVMCYAVGFLSFSWGALWVYLDLKASFTNNKEEKNE